VRGGKGAVWPWLRRLVHGFWGDAAHWAKVIVELKRRGYDSLHAVENPLTLQPQGTSRPSG